MKSQSDLGGALSELAVFGRRGNRSRDRQIGDGAEIRNQLTITRPIVSLPSMPARLPSNVPQPARPALTRRFPPTSSPEIAPTIGPTINPGKGKKSPAIAPSVAPKAPHFVAPNRFAPK